MTVLDRLHAGQPIRILIGEKLYDTAEIVPAEAYAARLRARLIAELTPPSPEPEPIEASVAMPFTGTGGA